MIDYTIGAELALTNAKKLQKLSIFAMHESQFGHACSLNILSAEEAIKACFCYLKSSFQDANFDGFDKIFTDHKTKHGFIKSFTILQEVILKQKEQLITIAKQNLEFAKSISVEAANRYEKSVGNILMDENWVNNRPASLHDLTEALSWWEEANLRKNTGLYVDYKNSKWISPDDINAEQYKKAKRYASIIIEFTEDLSSYILSDNIEAVKKQMQKENFNYRDAIDGIA